VPLKMFPFLAACEIAGAVGLVIGICTRRWHRGGCRLVLYFVGAVGATCAKSDVKACPAGRAAVVSLAALVLGALAA